jgi:hypothetical protein
VNVGKISKRVFHKIKISPIANEEGHRVGWDEAMILETESHSRYKKKVNRFMWHV